jgi:hypothetical protein
MSRGVCASDLEREGAQPHGNVSNTPHVAMGQFVSVESKQIYICRDLATRGFQLSLDFLMDVIPAKSFALKPIGMKALWQG